MEIMLRIVALLIVPIVLAIAWKLFSPRLAGPRKDQPEMLEISDVQKGPGWGDSIITVQWGNGHVSQYCGGSTVWRSFPEGKRQDTLTEMKLADLMAAYNFRKFIDQKPS